MREWAKNRRNWGRLKAPGSRPVLWGTKAVPSTPLRPKWSGQSEQTGGAGPPSTPLLHRGREPLPRDAAWRPRSPSIGQSHPQKRWTRMWTKSVAGDREAPSLESRWMWRYPVESAATCQVLCTPHPAGPGPRGAQAASHPWAQGTLSEDIRAQANRVSEAQTRPLPAPSPANLASGCLEAA